MNPGSPAVHWNTNHVNYSYNHPELVSHEKIALTWSTDFKGPFLTELLPVASDHPVNWNL